MPTQQKLPRTECFSTKVHTSVERQTHAFPKEMMTNVMQPSYLQALKVKQWCVTCDYCLEIRIDFLLDFHLNYMFFFWVLYTVVVRDAKVMSQCCAGSQ